jgi:hypothetical protein
MGCTHSAVPRGEANDQKKRELVVRSSDGTLVSLEFTGVPTVREIQERLAAATGLSADSLILTQSGNELQDADSRPCKCDDSSPPSPSLLEFVGLSPSQTTSRSQATSREKSPDEWETRQHSHHSTTSRRETRQHSHHSTTSRRSRSGSKEKPSFLAVACRGPYHGFGNNIVAQTGFGPRGDWCERCADMHAERPLSSTPSGIGAPMKGSSSSGLSHASTESGGYQTSTSTRSKTSMEPRHSRQKKEVCRSHEAEYVGA